MKSTTIISIVSTVIFSLTIVTSCQKYENAPPPPCNSCPTSTSNNRAVNLQVTNWTSNGDGFYRADFSTELQKQAGDYNELLKVAAETENGEIEIGISTTIPGGTISHYGTLLVFKSIGYGQTVYSPFKIKVWVE